MLQLHRLQLSEHRMQRLPLSIAAAGHAGVFLDHRPGPGQRDQPSHTGADIGAGGLEVAPGVPYPGPSAIQKRRISGDLRELRRGAVVTFGRDIAQEINRAAVLG